MLRQKEDEIDDIELSKRAELNELLDREGQFNSELELLKRRFKKDKEMHSKHTTEEHSVLDDTAQENLGLKSEISVVQSNLLRIEKEKRLKKCRQMKPFKITRAIKKKTENLQIKLELCSAKVIKLEMDF